jgi:hypothetical protein
VFSGRQYEETVIQVAQVFGVSVFRYVFEMIEKKMIHRIQKERKH